MPGRAMLTRNRSIVCLHHQATLVEWLGWKGLETLLQGVLEKLGEKERILPNYQGKNQPQATGSRNFSVQNHFIPTVVTRAGF